MRVLITGATGTIGRSVAERVRARGDQIVATSRDPDRASRSLGPDAEVHRWPDPAAAPPPAEALRVDGIVHLIGEPIDQRWTEDARRRIHDSRVKSTEQLVAGLESLPEAERPGVLVSQSAVGYYGDRGAETLAEDARAGAGWLAGVVVAWEEAARRAPAGVRVVCTRTGVVLSPSGGALAKMLPFFKLGIGGPVAGGEQYVPWIHLDDVVGGLLHCLDHVDATGAANLTAPDPVTNKRLSSALGSVLKRPAVLPVPGFAVSLLYGQMAELVTGGQRAVPARLQALGYGFTQTDIEDALADVLR
ncbi:MAG TPA: TIGR01777 family oxidoreductase [Solirubrobacteraceae bacterium]|nr:TIGR01777 family oxidoreductase [Solirubrobacteraceae bacterium]